MSEIIDDIVYGTFYQVNVPGEGTVNYPQDDYTIAEIQALLEVDEVNEVAGYFVEVMDDSTGELLWKGPFDSDTEAEEYAIKVTEEGAIETD